MENISDNLNKMLSDIKFIRASIEQNGDDIRKIFYTKAYRVAIWYCGIGMFVFALLHYYFIHHYGSFFSIPFETRVILITATVIFLISQQLIELGGWMTMLRRYPGVSFPKLFIKLLGRPLLPTYLILFVLMTAFIVYYIWIGQYQYIFPVFGIGAGLVCTILGNSLAFSEITFTGIFFIIPAVISIPFISLNPLSALVWYGFDFGLAFIITGIIIEVKLILNKGKKE